MKSSSPAFPLIALFLIALLAVVVWGLGSVSSPARWENKFSLELHGGQTVLGKQDAAGLPNLYRLDHQIFSGGEPQGETGFQSLADLGVKTVISVDGAEPDIVAAEAAGLKYLHLPIGYDAVPRSRIVELVTVIRELSHPVYIHCHRGLHRGPAAAVAACRAGGWLPNNTDIEALLLEMGTAPKYTGLFRDAGAAKPLTLQERQSIRASDLPSVASVKPLTHQMVELEHEWEHWGKGTTSETDWTAENAASATNLAELLIEAGRLMDETPESAALRAALIADGRWFAETVESRADAPEAVMKLMKRRCDTCHARFRDH